MNFNDEISTQDKIILLLNAGWKVIRGFWHKFTRASFELDKMEVTVRKPAIYFVIVAVVTAMITILNKIFKKNDESYKRKKSMNREKRRMAFVDLTDYHDWPMGGMLAYESAILPYLAQEYDLEIWGCSVNGVEPEPLNICGKRYPIRTFMNAITGPRLVPNYFKAYFAINKVKGKFIAANYDIIYAHTASCLVHLENYKNPSHSLFVLHQHGLSYLTTTDPKVIMQIPMYNCTQYLADLTFVVSSSSHVSEYAATMKNKTKCKFVPVKSPLNLKLFDKEVMLKKANAMIQSPIFVNTGRVCKWKNQRLLIDAFRKYLDIRNDNAKLYIVGDGPDISTLKQKVLDYGLEKNVFFEGRKRYLETLKYLERANIFVFPSKGEGMPLSILEAFASALPVVCFDVEGVGNIVRNRVNGVVVKDQTPEKFSAAMIEATDKYNVLAAGSLESANDFDAANVSKKIIDEVNAQIVHKNG